MALPQKTRVGRHKVTFVETTLDLAAINAASVDASNDVTVPGAEIGDSVTINWNNEAAAINLNAYVSAKHVVTIIAANATAGSINAASSTVYLAVHHRD